MVRDCRHRSLALLVLVLILGLTFAVPGAHGSRLPERPERAGRANRSAGALGHPAASPPASASPGARAAVAPATPGPSLWLWFERLLGRAFNLPAVGSPVLDAGGCSDPNGSACACNQPNGGTCS
jgi:hypothetical protein